MTVDEHITLDVDAVIQELTTNIANLIRENVVLRATVTALQNAARQAESK